MGGFCDIAFKRTNNTIEVKNTRGEKSPLYSKLIEYVNQNNVYSGREWFFDKLVEQGKLKNNNNQELALGLYSIAFNSGKSEGYWMNKIEELLPEPFYPQTGINEETLLPLNQIQYQLRLIDSIMKNMDKVKSWEKKIGLTDLFWQKIIELGITKQQTELLKQSEGKTLEEKLISFSSNYNFVVEINTAKTKNNPTQYYSNLTVNEDFYKNNPDWEYKEQRITTPLITPSIKGHAQFAESNDIGWFRAWYNKKTGEVHVIEVQSDLFQKGRDKEYLAKGMDNKMTKDNYPEDLVKEFTNQNQFLQLLNKDNNWVTFFVKSFIQDSAKKGYEKVLFPTGNTSAKVEGHTTLEEFKEEKEDRIKTIEEIIKSIENGTNFQPFQQSQDEWIPSSADREGEKTKYFTTKQEALDYSTKSYKNEINQLKQELERVETEGFGALKPIYNFYENTVTNILKKQGYNPVLITDEYGNTWNEVIISSKYKFDILFNQGSTTKEQQSIFNKGFTNIQQYLQFIADNKEPLSPLASNLLRFKTDNPVILTENLNLDIELQYSSDRKVVASYNPITKEIKINPYAEKPEVNLLHEYIHAVTYDHIRNFPDSKEVKELENLLAHTRTYKNITDKYPLENLDEFITGIFTNGRFIYDLQQIPHKGTNVLTKLIEWFSKLFKFTPKQETLFEEVFYKAEQLLDKIYQVENPEFEVDIQEARSDMQIESLLNKYGTGFGNELNPNTEWGKMMSDVAKANKDFKLNLTVYQAPTGKWYLRQTIISEPLQRSIPSIIDKNAQEVNLSLSELGNGLFDNWSNYFDGYSDLSDFEKKEIINLIEQGFVELSCKI